MSIYSEPVGRMVADSVPHMVRTQLTSITAPNPVALVSTTPNPKPKTLEALSPKALNLKRALLCKPHTV